MGKENNCEDNNGFKQIPHEEGLAYRDKLLRQIGEYLLGRQSEKDDMKQE